MRFRPLSFLSRLGFVWARRRVDGESRRELIEHLDRLTGRYITAGMTPEEARTAARRQLGNVTLVREDVHRMNGVSWVEGFVQNARYAVRELRRGRGFSAIVIATLALGIGATTAVFSVVQAVLLAPLPYDEPGQLVRLYQQEPENPTSRRAMTGPHFVAVRDDSTSFADMAGLFREVGLDLFDGGQAERLRVLPVTSDYFDTLRAGPMRGPGFDREDERGTLRVVLSDGLWRRRFGSDLSMIGATVRLSGETYQVVGIAPAGFKDPIAGEVDAWSPHDLVGIAGAGGWEEQNYAVTVVGRRCSCSSSPSDSCSLSCASMWRTSCSCARPGACTSSRYARHSAPVVAAWPGSS
jgi:putative ABC transport system permease protein